MAKRAEPSEGLWEIHAGVPRAKKVVRKIGTVEDLHYNNPYGYTIERVWFDGRVIYATEQGEVDVDPKKVKVAQEYQIVYAVKLNAKGTLVREPDRVPGQLNIYDSIPGHEEVQPDLAVQLRDRAARLRAERAPFGA